MAHQQFPTKTHMQKAENKVVLFPNAEYIIVLLSLPFNLSIAARATTEIQVTYTSLSTLDSHLRKQILPLISTGITYLNVMINRSEVWKQHLR